MALVFFSVAQISSRFALWSTDSSTTLPAFDGLGLLLGGLDLLPLRLAEHRLGQQLGCLRRQSGDGGWESGFVGSRPLGFKDPTAEKCEL
jgi:hypothetical protein